MWLLILEWDWSTRSHAHFPHVASKRTSFKRVCLKKEVSACLWRTHDLDSSCSSDKVKWGLRSCSSEQEWSLQHASPSRDIASKVCWTQLPGRPLTVGQGARKTLCKVFTDRTRYQQLFTEETLLRPVEPAMRGKRGNCEAKYSDTSASSIKRPIISPVDSALCSSQWPPRKNEVLRKHHPS